MQTAHFIDEIEEYDYDFRFGMQLASSRTSCIEKEINGIRAIVINSLQPVNITL